MSVPTLPPLTVKLSGGNSEGVIAMVTYNYMAGKATMTGFSITNGDAEYPTQTPKMEMSAMADDNGNLSTAVAFLDGNEVFACAIDSNKELGSNFQWLDKEGNTLSSDNCKAEGSGV